MPFSHYAYRLVDGKRQPTMLYQLDGESVELRRQLVENLTTLDCPEYLSTIPSHAQPAVDLEQLASILS